MKKIFYTLMLFIVALFTARAQTTIVNKLEIKTVATDTTATDVLVRGADRKVKKVPISFLQSIPQLKTVGGNNLFGIGDIPFPNYTTSTLQQVVDTGREAFNGSSFVKLLFPDKGTITTQLNNSTASNTSYISIKPNSIVLESRNINTKGSRLIINEEFITLENKNSSGGFRLLEFEPDLFSGSSTIRIPFKDGVHQIALRSDFKTINGESIIGTGNISISSGTTTPSYKVLVAKVNQSGTNAPVLTITENTTGYTITATRVSTGLYSFTWGVFLDENKVYGFTQDAHYYNTNPAGTYKLGLATYGGGFNISNVYHTYNNVTMSDGLYNQPIEIRIYN